MAYLIQTPGTNNILSLTSTTTGAGNWYRVDWRATQLAIQVVHTGTSAGVNVASTVKIEVSNDGVNALGTAAGSVALNGTTPQSDGFVMQRWEYIRANLQTASSTTAAGTAYSINVTVSPTLLAGA